MESCPLCGLSVNEESVSKEEIKPKKTVLRDKVILEYKSLTLRQKRKLFWEISGIILGSGILVTLIINYIVSRNISWSIYSVAVSLVLFANISIFTLWRQRPILFFFGSIISTSVILWLLDLFSSNTGWGIRLGIPILVSFYILLSAVSWLIRISRYRGFNILAIVFIAVGIFVICTEVFLSYYFVGEFRLSWSIIAAASVIPISAILIFMHYRLKTGMDLKRFFHI
jgi:hypothetical protein